MAPKHFIEPLYMLRCVIARLVRELVDHPEHAEIDDWMWGISNGAGRSAPNADRVVGVTPNGWTLFLHNDVYGPSVTLKPNGDPRIRAEALNHVDRFISIQDKRTRHLKRIRKVIARHFPDQHTIVVPFTDYYVEHYSVVVDIGEYLLVTDHTPITDITNNEEMMKILTRMLHKYA